ncbi:MAG: T9SS type A sorting domain-containing protein [Bacteroidetes bacterium]|nr:T9SS type A sorting domain-containing protein [Bacteroidota bacterium]
MKKLKIVIFFCFCKSFLMMNKSSCFAQCSQTPIRIGCNYEERFTCPVFKGKTAIFKDISYAKFTINKQWGKLPLAPDYCFPARYNSYKPDSLNEVFWNIYMDVYSPKISADSCTARPVIIFQHGGGLNPYNEDTRGNLTSKTISKYYADRGFVVFNMSYRMGWNAGRSGFVDESDTVFRRCYENYLNSNYGEEFSIMESHYRNVQDFRACHRMILNWNDTSTALKIDPDKVFYFGISTGGINAINAVYGAQELANTKNPITSIKLKNDPAFGGLDEFGGSQGYKNEIKVAGIITLAGGIINLENINFNQGEKTPLLLFQGDLDSIVPYNYGNLLYDTSLYNGLTQPKYMDIYGSHSIYNKIIANPENNPNINLYSYKCLGHETGLREFYDQEKKIQSCLSVGAEFMKKIINNQEVENKHFCILNNYSLETSETVDTDEEGEIFDCLPGTYIIEADTFIKPTDTIYTFIDSIITIDSIFIPDTGWVYSSTINYVFDTTYITGDTIFLPSDTIDILYTPRDITISNPNISNLFDFNIFPNPVSNDFINIKLNQKADIKTLSVYDILGKIFLEINDIPSKSDLIKVDISSLPKGIFLINIQTEKQMISRKFIRN